MRRGEMAIVCAILVAAFPAWAATEQTIEMYLAMLGDLDAELVLRAAQDWVLNEEKFPTIAGIRKRCAEIAGVLTMSGNEAWAEVSDAVDRYGSHNWSNLQRTPWSNEAITKAVKAIGWWEICQNTNPSAVRAQFLKMYAEFTEKRNTATISSRGFQIESGIVALPNSTMVESKALSN